MKRFSKILWKTVKWGFIVFCVFLASLFFREQAIPVSWVTGLVESQLPTNYIFHCERASVGFLKGVRLRGVRIYDREKANPLESVGGVDDLSVNPLMRSVTAVSLKFPRLPDGYYRPGNRERHKGVEATLPDLPDFNLTLIRPEILGFTPERVTATLKCSPRRFEIASYHLVWPDTDCQMALDGFTYVDLNEQRVNGEAHGLSRQANFRPFLETLDLPSTMPYFDAFTDVTEPVKCSGAWDVNLVNNDFRLHLDLHPRQGKYNGVPMRTVDGEVSLYVFTRGTNLNYVTTVGPLSAIDAKGRPLDGSVTIRGTNGVVRLSFDARSALALPGLLSVADCLNDGVLDCLACETPPSVTIGGNLFPDVRRQADNDMKGTVSFAKGSFFSIPVSDVSFAYAYRGDTIRFTDAKACGKDGGHYGGECAIHVPGLDAERASFDLGIDIADGTLSELAGAMGFDFAGRSGRVNGRIDLTGPMSTNLYPHLSGSGSIRVTDGQLAQMKLFMGLTDYLAKNVPGIASLVNQSRAKIDFTLENGLFSAKDLRIEGDLFTITASGTYDIPNDRLDFTVGLRILRDDTILGKLVHPVTLPFAKLLLQFRVTGPVGDPKWKYNTVLDRVL